jgi:hypothetical protein
MTKKVRLLVACALLAGVSACVQETVGVPVAQAKGADPVLRYRPQLQARAEQEIPAGRGSNIPDLVKTVARLKLLAARHPGREAEGSVPLGEPALVYLPSDEELLLSLAGDRIWRSLQIAPVGTVEDLRRRHPDWEASPIDYPQIEIVEVKVEGTGPRLFARPPRMRHLQFKP